MLASRTRDPEIRACPLELLVRPEFGSTFDHYVRRNEVVRVQPGVYAHATEWRQLAPWDRYLARVHAVQRRRPNAVFVLESAAALIGLPFLGDPGYVHILADTKGAARITGRVRGHFSTDPVSPQASAGFAVTNVLDTAVSIARTRHPAYGLAVLDHGIRVHGLTTGGIAAANDQRESTRGRAHARWSIERATGLPESVFESISRAVIEWLGFAIPELQVAFDLGRYGDSRVDAYWRGANIIGEADGDSKYRLDSGGVSAALISEKKREDALRRLADGFARWGWADCRDPQRLERILVDAGVPRVHPRDNTHLRTVRALLTP